MAERYPTVGGMDWIDHVEPPSTVLMTAAPFGAPAVPTVEPTAQQREGPTQSTPVSELTGAGSVTLLSFPTHGDPGAMVDGAPEPVFELFEVQDAATTDTTTTRATDIRAAAPDGRRRPGRRVIGMAGGELTGGGVFGRTGQPGGPGGSLPTGGVR
jgi:hypothetical protein